MLRYKFRGNRFIGCLKGFYPMIYGRSCDPDAGNRLLFPLSKETPHRILALIGHAVLEKLFEMVDGRTDGRRRTPDLEIYYKLTW